MLNLPVPRDRGSVARLAFVVAIIGCPLLTSNDYWLSVMVMAGLYATLALGLGLLLGQAGQISLGHAAFFGIGAYTSALLTTRLDAPPALALLAGTVLSGVVAYVVGRPVLRLTTYFLALATLGLGTMFAVLVRETTWLTGGPVGIVAIPWLEVGGFAVDSYLKQYYVVWILLLALLFVTERAMRSRVGRALRALAVSEVAASTLGIYTANWKLRAFVVSAVYAGIGGGLYAFVMSAVSHQDFGAMLSMLVVIMVMVGGMSSLFGAVVGAVLMTWVGRVFSGYQELSGSLYALVLIALLLFMPEGLAGGLSPERVERLKALLGLVRRRRSDLWLCREPALTGVTPSSREQAGTSPPHGPLVPTPSEGTSFRDAPDGAVAPGGITQVQLVGATAPPAEGHNAEGYTAQAPTKTGQHVGAVHVAPSNEPLLRLEGVSVFFGGLQAMNQVSMTIRKGDISALIGPNGAGKTTLFNVLTGLQRPSAGRVWFAGREITHRSAADIARLGMARTFQNLRVFGNMTVLENVMVGRHRHEKAGFFTAALGLGSQVREEQESRRRSLEALALVGLQHLADWPVTALPYGQQRLVEIARALATEPRLLLLDEPAAGMNASERAELVEKVARVREAGVTVLLVEHDMNLVMGISDRVSVLNYGKLIAEGEPEKVQANPAVIEAYLGVGTRSTELRTPPQAEPPAELVESTVPVQLEVTEGLPGERTREGMVLLEVERLSTYYGSIGAVRDVSLHVLEGEILAILGSNGAGKTTLLRTISGILRQRSGQVVYEGAEITHLSPQAIAARGIGHVPEGRLVFPTLTVQDNLLLGACRRHDQAELRRDYDFVYDLFPSLVIRRRQMAGKLSGGEQQMLAIGRALMGRPKLLLLDEPSMGLAPLVVESIFDKLATLNRGGLTLIMVEQKAEMALSIAHHAVVLQTGKVALSGPAATVRQDERVRELYLGVKEPMNAGRRLQDGRARWACKGFRLV